jgi:transcriptional regulator
VTRLKEMGAHNEDVARLVGMSITNISRYDKNEAHKIGHAIDTSLLAYSLSL